MIGMKSLFDGAKKIISSPMARHVGVAALKGAGTGAILGAGTAAVTGDNIMTGAAFGALGGGVLRGSLLGSSGTLISKIAKTNGGDLKSAYTSFVKWGGRSVKMAGVAGGLFAGSRVGPSDDPSYKGPRGFKSFSRGINGNRGQRF